MGNAGGTSFPAQVSIGRPSGIPDNHRVIAELVLAEESQLRDARPPREAHFHFAQTLPELPSTTHRFLVTFSSQQTSFTGRHAFESQMVSSPEKSDLLKYDPTF